MTNLKEMPLDTTLQKGDVVTITGPGEHDVLVREVTGVRFSGIAEGADLNTSTNALIPRNGRTLTRVQRPVPALPTVEGDYILATTNGYRSVVSLRDGVWLNCMSAREDVHWLTAHVSEGATLTRVIPADQVKHPEVDVKAAVEEFAYVYETSEGSAEDDFEAVLRRVVKGDFDK